MPRKNIGIVDKAKPRVIVGRLPAIIGGGPAVPEMEQVGKATGPVIQDGRVAEATGVVPKGPWLKFTTGFFIGDENDLNRKLIPKGGQLWKEKSSF